MKIYLASPFFNEEEIALRDEVLSFVEGLGFEVYSPERDASKIIARDADNYLNMSVQEQIREADIIALTESDLFLAVLNHPDTGVAYERGYASARHIPCLDFYKDKKDTDFYNLMLSDAHGTVATYDSMRDFLEAFKHLHESTNTAHYGTPFFMDYLRGNLKDFQKIKTSSPEQEETHRINEATSAEKAKQRALKTKREQAHASA